jgi:drug/metabolite transporter (DMT)-like permease
MICFAVNSVITRYLVLVSKVSPFLVTTIRFVSGLVVLLALTSFRPASFSPAKINSTYMPGALFLGVYGFSISYGYLFIPVAAGTLVFYTSVVMTMVAYSIIKDKEKLTIRLSFGLLLGLLGVITISFGKVRAVTLPGVLLMIATGASWGLYSVYGRRFPVTFGYTFNSFLMLGVFAAVASPAMAYLDRATLANVSPLDLGLALYMGMVSTALSYVLWNRTMKQIPAYLGGVVQIVVPILAAIMGIVFLAEQITIPLILGGALVLSGIYLVQFKRPPSRP